MTTISPEAPPPALASLSEAVSAHPYLAARLISEWLLADTTQRMAAIIATRLADENMEALGELTGKLSTDECDLLSEHLLGLDYIAPAEGVSTRNLFLKTLADPAEQARLRVLQPLHLPNAEEERKRLARERLRHEEEEHAALALLRRGKLRKKAAQRQPEPEPLPLDGKAAASGGFIRRPVIGGTKDKDLPKSESTIRRPTLPPAQPPRPKEDPKRPEALTKPVPPVKEARPKEEPKRPIEPSVVRPPQTTEPAAPSTTPAKRVEEQKQAEAPVSSAPPAAPASPTESLAERRRRERDEREREAQARRLERERREMEREEEIRKMRLLEAQRAAAAAKAAAAVEPPPTTPAPVAPPAAKPEPEASTTPAPAAEEQRESLADRRRREREAREREEHERRLERERREMERDEEVRRTRLEAQKRVAGSDSSSAPAAPAPEPATPSAASPAPAPSPAPVADTPAPVAAEPPKQVGSDPRNRRRREEIPPVAAPIPAPAAAAPVPTPAVTAAAPPPAAPAAATTAAPVEAEPPAEPPAEPISPLAAPDPEEAEATVESGIPPMAPPPVVVPSLGKSEDKRPVVLERDDKEEENQPEPNAVVQAEQVERHSPDADESRPTYEPAVSAHPTASKASDAGTLSSPGERRAKVRQAQQALRQPQVAVALSIAQRASVLSAADAQTLIDEQDPTTGQLVRRILDSGQLEGLVKITRLPESLTETPAASSPAPSSDLLQDAAARQLPEEDTIEMPVFATPAPRRRRFRLFGRRR